MKSVFSNALGAIAMCAAGLLSVAPAHAGSINGGSALLSPAQHGQLESWLGQGSVNLNNVFTLQPGMDSNDFHSAVDERGATFSLMLVGNETDRWLVGGYNPQSWDSLERWHETPADKDRVAFIFNLTSESVFHQVPATYILPSQGEKQTWNSGLLGPAFGEGGDLWVTGDMQNAYSWLATYGDPSMQGLSMIDGTIPEPLPAMMTLYGMEVFTISPVPEPGSTTMFAGGLLVLAVVMSRRRRRVNKPSVV